MLHNKNHADTTVDGQIEIHELAELAYWSEKLGVSKLKIVEAVRAVGPMVADVKAYLEKQPAL